MVPITLERLRKVFGSTVAVDDVDLHIAAGERFFLLGPSGCGKTTLLRMIAGFVEPSAGRIRFADQDVTALPADRRQTGMVFQGYALWPHMTVRENVVFGLQVRKLAASEQRRRVDTMLEAVGLAKLAERRPGALSGGQQQRVALARALVIEPRVLLLDEPLANLDAALRIELRGQILALCRRTGTTAIYVTHDQAEALALADRIGVLRDGRLLQVGGPDALYHQPASRFVAEFLGRTNVLEATVIAVGDGRIRVQTPLGPLEAGFSTAMKMVEPGAAVWASIRPESWRRGGGGDDAAVNRVTIQCLETTFQGATVDHDCRGAAGVTLRVSLPARERMAVDERAALEVEARDVVLMKRGD